jgi:hypothetical protein
MALSTTGEGVKKLEELVILKMPFFLSSYFLYILEHLDFNPKHIVINQKRKLARGQ